MQAKIAQSNPSPYKKSLKNRRNISIKQSWDRPKLNHPNLTTTNAVLDRGLFRNQLSNSKDDKGKHQRIVAQHNMETMIKFQPSGEPLSPKINALETVESPKAQNVHSDYYSTTYARAGCPVE